MGLRTQYRTLIQLHQFQLLSTLPGGLSMFIFTCLLKVGQFGFLSDKSIYLRVGNNIAAKRSLIAFSSRKVPGAIHMEYPV